MDNVVRFLGVPYIQTNLNFITNFQVVMHFVAKLEEEPGNYFHNDYLAFREEPLMRFRDLFLSKVQKLNQKQPPSTPQHLSPHGQNYGPEQTESHFSPQSSQVKPNVSNVSSRVLTSSHPNSSPRKA